MLNKQYFFFIQQKNIKSLSSSFKILILKNGQCKMTILIAFYVPSFRSLKITQCFSIFPTSSDLNKQHNTNQTVPRNNFFRSPLFLLSVIIFSTAKCYSLIALHWRLSSCRMSRDGFIISLSFNHISWRGKLAVLGEAL